MPRDLRYINRSRSHEASLRAVLVYLSMISWLGLHQLGLAFCLLVIHHIHRNLFTCFSIAHLEDLQNQTIICANYSTTRCSRLSIIPPDREHASLLLQASWTFLQEGTTLHSVVGLSSPHRLSQAYGQEGKGLSPCLRLSRHGKPQDRPVDGAGQRRPRPGRMKGRIKGKISPRPLLP